MSNGEQENKLMSCTGICRFCGQVLAIKMPYDATEDEKDLEASYRCTCEGGREYSASIDRIALAEASIDELFGVKAGDKSVGGCGIEILKSCVTALEKGTIDSASFTFKEGCKAKLNKTGRGTIKVARSDTTTKAYEA